MAERIAGQDRTLLLEQPESGLGYQLLKDGDVLILNAAVAIRVDKESWSIHPKDLSWLYTDYFPLFNGVAPRPEDYDSRLAAEQEVLAKLTDYAGNLEIEQHGSYSSIARHGEVFIRYSAFWPDRRIAADGSVGLGTYVTTENDKAIVPSGLAAVGRYALPNPAPAIYEYTIGPVPGKAISCGTCAPLFGQAGGGVEIRFDNPLDPGSANPTPVSIPER